jgi:hypothetical protein
MQFIKSINLAVQPYYKSIIENYYKDPIKKLSNSDIGIWIHSFPDNPNKKDLICLFNITYNNYNCISIYPYYIGEYETRQMIYSIFERICCEYISKQLSIVKKLEANDITFKCFVYLEEEFKDPKLKCLNKDVTKTRYNDNLPKKMNEYVFIYQFVDDIYNYEKCFLNIDINEYNDYSEIHSKLI